MGLMVNVNDILSVQGAKTSVQLAILITSIPFLFPLKKKKKPLRLLENNVHMLNMTSRFFLFIFI